MPFCVGCLFLYDAYKHNLVVVVVIQIDACIHGVFVLCGCQLSWFYSTSYHFHFPPAPNLDLAQLLHQGISPSPQAVWHHFSAVLWFCTSYSKWNHQCSLLVLRVPHTSSDNTSLIPVIGVSLNESHTNTMLSMYVMLEMEGSTSRVTRTWNRSCCDKEKKKPAVEVSKE